MDSYYSDGGCLAADPNNNSVFWSGGNYTFAMFASKTTNSGDTWMRYCLTGVGHTYALAVDPSNSNIVYAGGNPGIFKTTNSGTNWIDVSSGITEYVMTIEINPLFPNIIYAGTRDGVFKSTDSGANWANIGLNDVNSLLIDPSAPDTIYAGTITGVYVSTSGGSSWQSMNTGLEDTNITCLDIEPGVYLYAATYGTGMYRWSLEPGISEKTISQKNTVLFAHANPVNHELTVRFRLVDQSKVNLIIYDAKGALIKEFAEKLKSPGIHSYKWDGKDTNGLDVSSGVYFYRLSTSDANCMRKFILLK